MVQKKKKGKNFIIGLTIAAVLPLTLYFIMRLVSDGSLIIPDTYHYEEIIPITTDDGNIEYDTIFHKIDNIQLTNQLGREVNLNQQLKSKIWVLSFFHTNCAICDETTELVNKVQKSFIHKNPDLVHFISFAEEGDSIDDIETIREYGDKFKADHDRWWFLTGEREEISRIAVEELGIDTSKKIKNHNHIHQIILVDTFRNIRGYYNGQELVEGKNISDDIVILNMEKRKNK